MHTTDPIADRLLDLPHEKLDARTLKVTQHIAKLKHITRNLAQELAMPPSLGQRAADGVAKFG